MSDTRCQMSEVSGYIVLILQLAFSSLFMTAVHTTIIYAGPLNTASHFLIPRTDLVFYAEQTDKNCAKIRYRLSVLRRTDRQFFCQNKIFYTAVKLYLINQTRKDS